MKKYSLMILCLVWISCESGGNGYRNIFNSHYGNAFPVKEITFKSEKNTSVTLQATIKDGMGSTPLNLQDATYFGGKFIFADGFSKRLLITDENFKMIRYVGREGKGPYEFDGSIELFSNDSLLFVYDEKLRRVQSFNGQFELVNTEALVFPSYPLNAEAGGNSAAIPVINESQGTIYLFQGPLKGKYFHKPLTPPGRQPRALNASIYSYAGDETIYVAYKALPYVFRYESEGQITLKEIYHLGGSDTENYMSQPLRGGSNNKPGIMVRIFFDAMTAFENKLILIHRGMMFVLNPEEKRVIGPYKLSHDAKHFNIHSVRRLGDKVFVYDRYEQQSGVVEFSREGEPNLFTIIH